MGPSRSLGRIGGTVRRMRKVVSSGYWGQRTGNTFEALRSARCVHSPYWAWKWQVLLTCTEVDGAPTLLIQLQEQLCGFRSTSPPCSGPSESDPHSEPVPIPPTCFPASREKMMPRQTQKATLLSTCLDEPSTLPPNPTPRDRPVSTSLNQQRG